MDHEVFGLAPTSSRFVKLRVYSYGVIKTVQSLEFTCQEWSRIFLWPFRLRIVIFPGSSPKMLCLRQINWFCLWDFLLDTVLSILSIVVGKFLEITTDSQRDASPENGVQHKSGQTHLAQQKNTKEKHIQDPNLNWYFISCHRELNARHYTKGDECMKFIPLM